MEPLLGAHLSIAGGIPRAIDRAEQVGARVLQIFVKNSNRWEGRPLAAAEVEAFHQARAASGLCDIVAHGSYLINLAASHVELRRRSVIALVEEMTRSERLGLSHLVTHPGAHGGDGETAGILRVAQAIDEIHDRVGDCRVRIALEGTAGQGTSLGYRFEHLRDILGNCRHPERVSVCLDTCHLFAAGYDFRPQVYYWAIMEEFDRIVGLSKLRILHMNDSKKEAGSRVDRHEHIGKGKIGRPAFSWIMTDPLLRDIPKIIETPKGKTLREDRRNLRALGSLIPDQWWDECVVTTP